MERPADGGASGISLARADPDRASEILSPGALVLLEELHRRFEPRRRALLARRDERQAGFDAGELPDFLDETKDVREGTWQVPPAPRDLADRRVEITGPVERKMMINALNSGARAFMADFEDACSPTWANLVDGQANVADAVRRTISLTTPEREYRLNDRVATLLVRPRGWHLVERHVTVDGDPVSASLFDAGLFLFHNARELTARGSGPYLYLAKLEGRQEAALWHDVLSECEDALGLPRGTVRVTVLIETILAAFEMDEILWALGEHATGLNAGRWDYIFSVIKKFRSREEFVLPDRAQVTMTVPFMRSYSRRLVDVCHRHGAHAIGGMAAFIPNRRKPEVTERALAKVREDKVREAGDGFDGTWVAHPDLVPVATDVFDGALGERPNQLDHTGTGVAVAADLLDVAATGGTVTEAGLRTNVNVGVRYVASWLTGTGAAAIDDLMEDAATAEISRSQVWQWIRHGTRMDDGRTVTAELAQTILEEETQRLRDTLGEAGYAEARIAEARQLFERVALSREFIEFLTIPASEAID
ncbi:MAG TPA: malate synthase A [Actinomycetota bacterium]|nr:malate synthase A [Actinomycetota bacterium]